MTARATRRRAPLLAAGLTALALLAPATVPAATATATAAASPPPAAGAAIEAPAPDAAAEECTASTRESSPVPALSQLQADDVWSRTRGAGVTVAVVDSGVAFNPHLAGVVTGGVNLVPDGTNPDGSADTFGHGTAIAGQIAAQVIPGSGVQGLAPEAKILPVRVFAGTDQQQVEAGWGPSTARMAEGIRYAADQGAQIVNVSMSTVAPDAALAEAVSYATARGSLVVGSSGNRDSSLAVEESESDGTRYPAGFPEALGVSATDTTGVVTEASVHGPHVRIAAPGQLILSSSAAGGDCVFAAEAPATSYAAAYVSAAAALVASVYPDETPAQWAYRLEASAVRADPDRRDDAHGWGVVQPYDAIALIPGTGIRGPASPFAVGEAPAPPAVVDAPVEVVHDPGADAAAITWAVLITVGALVVLAAVAALGVYVTRRAETAATAPRSRSGGLYRDSPSA